MKEGQKIFIRRYEMSKRLWLFFLAATLILPVAVFARGGAETTAAEEKGPVTLTCF
jgi:hypothetical protein